MSFEKLSSDVLRKHKGISYPGVTTSFLCYDSTGRVFQAKRSKNARDEHGRWDFGGGGLKHGQSLIDNLKREVKEEYNFTALKIDFVGYLDVFRNINGLDTHWLCMAFTVLVNPEEFNLNEPEMVDDYGWFTLDSLPEPQHTITPLYFQQYEDKIRSLIAEGIKASTNR